VLVTVNEMIEQLINLRTTGWGDAELAVDTQHGCCDPMGFSDAATCYPPHSMIGPPRPSERAVVVLRTSETLL